MDNNYNGRGLQLAAGTVLMLFMGLIYAWSIFRRPLSDIFTSWTTIDISLTFTISITAFCFGGFICGKLTAALGTRRILAACALLLFAGFFGLSFYNADDPRGSLVLLYICYGVLCGGGIGMAYNAILSSTAKWFPDNAGMASGVLLMGFGVGGLALGGLVSVLMSAMELSRVFAALGVLMGIALLAGAFLIGPPVTPVETCADEEASNAGPARLRRSYTVSEMLKTPAFWLFACWMILISSTGLLVMNSAAVISAAFGASAVLGLVVSIFNGAGRIIFGTMFDRIGRRKTMLADTLLMLFAGIVLTVGALADSAVLIFCGLSVVGVAFGGPPPITVATVNAFYGPKSFGANLGTINFAVIVSAMIGPIISSILQEASGGGYTTTFMMIIALAAAALGVTLLLTPFCGELETPAEPAGHTSGSSGPV